MVLTLGLPAGVDAAHQYSVVQVTFSTVNACSMAFSVFVGTINTINFLVIILLQQPNVKLQFKVYRVQTNWRLYFSVNMHANSIETVFLALLVLRYGPSRVEKLLSSSLKNAGDDCWIVCLLFFLTFQHDLYMQYLCCVAVSILNSLVIVLFLSGMVAMIMLRTLHKDIARYNQMDDSVSWFFGCLLLISRFSKYLVWVVFYQLEERLLLSVKFHAGF